MYRPIKPRFGREIACVATLFMALFSMEGAQAQWLVTDTAAISSNEKGQAQQLGQLVKEYTQLQQMYETIRSTIGSLGLNLVPINNQIPLISDSDQAMQAKQQCGADVTSQVIQLIPSILGLDTNGDLKTQQLQLCEQIALRKFHKYNTVAQMLNRMNSYSDKLDSIMTTFDSISALAEGDREKSDAQTNQTLTSMSMDMNNTTQLIQADDAMISALESRQSMLGNMAMKGSPTLIGNAMQAVIFAEALSH